MGWCIPRDRSLGFSSARLAAMGGLLSGNSKYRAIDFSTPRRRGAEEGIKKGAGWGAERSGRWEEIELFSLTSSVNVSGAQRRDHAYDAGVSSGAHCTGLC